MAKMTAKTAAASKPVWESKTFWFNVAAAAVEITGVLPVSPGVATSVVAVGNIALRLLTTQPVSVR